MEPLWTDKLESIATAIAALAAIIAGIYAILAYKKQNKDVQEQLNSLKILAEHQAKEIEMQREFNKINIKRRISEIAPILKYDLRGTTTINGVLREQPYIRILNEGEIARKIIIECYSYKKSIKIGEFREDYLDRYNNIQVEINEDVGHEQFNCDIIYFDKDDNQYQQGFGFNYIEGHIYVKESKLVATEVIDSSLD
jgi:ABC-type Fe3+-citrate transport system substrate-binding protein